MRAAEVAEKLLMYYSLGLSDRQLSNMKLNMMMYYMQAYYLVNKGEPAFADPIEAWKNGPVVRVVYDKYRGNGKDLIPIPIFGIEDLKPNEDEIYLLMCSMFRGKSAISMLRKFKKSSNPWSEAYSDYPNKTISHDELKRFFSLPENHMTTVEEMKNTRHNRKYSKLKEVHERPTGHGSKIS